MTHSPIARSHFNARVLRALARKGIRVVGLQAVPAWEGDTFLTGTGYVLDDRGTCRVRTLLEVLALAG